MEKILFMGKNIDEESSHLDQAIRQHLLYGIVKRSRTELNVSVGAVLAAALLTGTSPGAYRFR